MLAEGRRCITQARLVALEAHRRRHALVPVLGDDIAAMDGVLIGQCLVDLPDRSCRQARGQQAIAERLRFVLRKHGCKFGARVIVHAGAVLGSDGFGYVRDRKTGHYEKFPQVGCLVIEDDVEIGANSTIDRGALDETRICHGAKIDNLVHIGHNCHIGEDVVIAAQTGLSGSIVIEKGVILGGQVGIGEHARIEEGVMLGGQGGVLPNKVLRGKGVAFWGTPAQPLREYLKQLATLARLAKKDRSRNEL